MKSYRFALAPCLATIFSFSAAAQSPDLDALFRRALDNSPSIQSTIASNQAQNLEMARENLLEDPEVELQHEWGNKEAEGNKWNISVTQSFDWPGLYKARNDARKAQRKAADLQLSSQRLEMLLELKLNALKIVKVRRDLKAQEEIVAHYKGLVAMNSVALQQGDITVLDLSKIRLASIEATRALDKLRIELRQAQGELLSACGDERTANEIISLLTDYPAEQLPSETEYENYLRNSYPEILANNALAEMERQNVRVAHRSALPGFTLGYMYENEQVGAYNGLIAGMTIPLWSTRHQANIARLQQEALAYDNQALLIRLTDEMRSERRNALSLLNIVEEYHAVLESTDYEDLLKKSLTGGQISVREYIEEIDFYLEARQKLNEAKYELACSFARLNWHSLLN